MSSVAFEVSYLGTTAILALSREGLDNNANLRQEIIDFIDEHQPRRMIIRFAGINFFSSEMINSLLRAREAIMRYGGDMKLCELRPEIHESIRILNLEDRIFDIYPGVDEANDAWNA